MCLQPPGAGDLGDLSRVLLDRKLIQRKRRRLVLDLQVALVHPNRDIFPGQAQFYLGEVYRLAEESARRMTGRVGLSPGTRWTVID